MRFPKQVSELINEGFCVSGLKDRLREADIWRFWPEVAGPVVASRARPLRIINGVLTVAVSSGPWLQELNFLKGIMKDKLNARLGGEVIRDIILKSGRVFEDEIPSDDETFQRRKLTEQQTAFIAKQASEISDPETREAFAALMQSSFESVPDDRS